MAEKEIKSIWDLDEFEPFKKPFMARVAIFANREAYYNGDVYEPIGVAFANRENPLGALLATQLSGPVGRLNTLIRGLFQPLSETVKIDVGLVGGDWLLIPEQRDRQSDFDTFLGGTGDLYIHYGAMMGNGTLMIIDDRQSDPPAVRMQAIRPDQVLPVYQGMRAGKRLLVMAIIVERVEYQGEVAEEAIVITERTIRTYRNGKPAILHGDKAQYANQLGFVPIVDQPFIDIGQDIGENTYLHTMKQLDEVNLMASQLADNIAKNENPQWAVMTDDEMPEEPIGRSDDQLWLLSAGSQVQAIVAQLDIDGILGFITKVYEELEKKLSEYLLYKLIGLNRIAVAGLKIQLLPLTIHIMRARRSMDRGMQAALEMANQAADSMKINMDWLEGIQLDKDRRVIPFDQLTLLELEQKEIQVETQRQILAAQQALASGDGMAEGDLNA